jgi:hypothetical protein
MFLNILYYFSVMVSIGWLGLVVTAIYSHRVNEYIISITWNVSKGGIFLKDKGCKMLQDINKYLTKSEKKTILDVNGEERVIDVNKKFVILEIKENNIETRVLTFMDFKEYGFNKSLTYYIQLDEEMEVQARYKELKGEDIGLIKTESMLLNYILKDQDIVKPFIHVTLNVNNEKIDIHEHLDKYYVDGNEILSFKFLKWYLKHYYEKLLVKPYTIYIIDSNVKMVELGQSQGVYISNNTYEVYICETNPGELLESV